MRVPLRPFRDEDAADERFGADVGRKMLCGPALHDSLEALLGELDARVRPPRSD